MSQFFEFVAVLAAEQDDIGMEGCDILRVVFAVYANKILSLAATHEGLVVLLAQVDHLFFLAPQGSGPALIFGDHAVDLASFLRLQQSEEAEVPSSDGSRGPCENFSVAGREGPDDGRPSEELSGRWVTMAATPKAERLK
jgi:hypothetical protein